MTLQILGRLRGNSCEFGETEGDKFKYTLITRLLRGMAVALLTNCT